MKTKETISEIKSLLKGFVLTVTMVLSLINFSEAQDIHFSQYNSSPLNLNPSLTGLFEGDYRFTAIHRSQWKSVTIPYKSFSGSADMFLSGISKNKNRFNAGILFNNDIAGDSKMGTNACEISISAVRSLDKDSIHFISAGIQTGYVLRSINFSTLTFDEQYNGDIFDPTIGNTEQFSNDSHGYLDVSSGITYIFKSSGSFIASTGISIQHLNKPNDAFFSQKVSLEPRTQIHLNISFPLSVKLDLLPSMLYMLQGGHTEFTPGSALRYRISELPGRNYAVSTGCWIRTGDAFIINGAIEYNSLRFGLAYDANTSDLDRASNGKGGYEIALAYIIRKVKPIGIKPPCPLY